MIYSRCTADGDVGKNGNSVVCNLGVPDWHGVSQSWFNSNHRHMIFIVKRTSQFSDCEDPPCVGAIKTKFPVFDVRTCPEQELSGRDRDTWRSIGRNHRTLDNGYIERQLGDEHLWSMEFDSLEEVIGFIESNGGHIVIEAPNYNSNRNWYLEIYDEYRE